MLLDSKSTKNIVRETYRQANRNYEMITEDMSSDIIDYFSRQNDNSSIKELMMKRFGYGITKIDGKTSVYTRGAVGTAIQADMYEVVSSGLGNKIINALANLFTMPTQHFEFVGDSETQVLDLEEIINFHRENGNLSLELITADRISCAVGACPVLIQTKGNKLCYKAFSPGAINFIFGESVEDGGALRPVDEMDIEDASAVVIQMEQNSISANKKYLAIIGRSKEFLDGRYVTYEAQHWNAIPDVGMGGHDYLIDGNPANPLSYLVNKFNLDAPEYPVIIIHGGQNLLNKKIIEINSSLYENCLELDLGFSRIMKDALTSAHGTMVLSNPMNSSLPPSLEGNVVLGLEQKLESLSLGSENSRVALEVLTGISKSVAEGYSVPGYTVLQDGSNESGISLLIKNKPLIDHRNFRVKLNSSEINKLFLIEKNLIEFLAGKSSGEITQRWNPGNFDLPETDIERVERIKIELDAGFISKVKAVKEFYNLSTENEALMMIEKIKEQQEEIKEEENLVFKEDD